MFESPKPTQMDADDMYPYDLRKDALVAALDSSKLDVEGAQPLSALQGEGSSGQCSLITSYECLMPPPGAALASSSAATQPFLGALSRSVPCRLPATHRTLLVGWMREVTGALRLQLTTLFTATHLLDRFVASTQMLPPDSMLQLLALTCMSVAVKYNEAQPISPSEWLNFAVGPDGGCLYQPEDLARFEQLLCETLGPDIQKPTALSVLRQMLPVCCPCGRAHEHNTALGGAEDAAIAVNDCDEAANGAYGLMATLMVTRAYGNTYGPYRTNGNVYNSHDRSAGVGNGAGRAPPGRDAMRSSAAAAAGGSGSWRHTNEMEAPLLSPSDRFQGGPAAESRACGCPFARLAESLLEISLPYDVFGLYSPTTCALACLTVAERLESSGASSRGGAVGMVGESPPGWLTRGNTETREAHPMAPAAVAVTAAVRLGIPSELSKPGLEACVEAVKTCYMSAQRQRT